MSVNKNCKHVLSVFISFSILLSSLSVYAFDQAQKTKGLDRGNGIWVDKNKDVIIDRSKFTSDSKVIHEEVKLEPEKKVDIPKTTAEKMYEPVTDRYIVKFKESKNENSVKKSLQVKSFSALKTGIESYGEFEVITFNEKISHKDAIAKIKKDDVAQEIEYIQPDFRMTVASVDSLSDMQWGIEDVEISKNSPEFEEGVQSIGIYRIIENDSVYVSVYGEVYTGALPFTIGANVSPAWNESQGEGVIIAVIDTGMDITHEDLYENVWINIREIPGNGIDDDGNGFIDDITGWDFCENDGEVHKQNLLDQEWHATHIAGIIAASKDNNKGIAGVAPKAKIMPLRVFKDGSAYTSDIINAIEYAEKMGAKIVNCSWGSVEYNPALKETMEKSGMVFVCSVGNNAMDIGNRPVYPARYDIGNIITVASINKDGNLSLFSNYSEDYTNVAAPGQNIISTIPGNRYDKSNGTSMSAGYVSGEAALLFSKYPDMSPGELKQRIMDSSDRLFSLVGKVNGANKINVGNAVTGSYSPDRQMINVPINENLIVANPQYYDAKGFELFDVGNTVTEAYYLNETGDNIYGNSRTYAISRLGAARIRVHFQSIQIFDPMSMVSTDAGDSWFGDYSNVWSNWKNGYEISISLSAFDIPRGSYTIDMIEYEILTADDHGNYFGTATVVGVGSQTPGIINYAEDYDVFKFIPSTSGTYVIETTGDTDTYCEFWEEIMPFWDSDNIGNGNNNFRFIESLEANWIYYFKVRHASVTGTGSYTFVINNSQEVDDHGNDFGTATVVGVGSQTPGEINYAEDYDVFKFVPPTNGTYLIETMGDTDTYCDFWEENMPLCDSDNIGNGNNNFRFIESLEANWIYYFKVRHASGTGTGSYTFVINNSQEVDDHGNDFGTATVVGVGSQTPGIINYAEDYDVFKFIPSTSGTYVIETTGNINSYGELWDELYQPLGESDNIGNGNNNFLFILSLDANWTYYIKVRHASVTGTGSYTFVVKSGLPVLGPPTNITATATSTSITLNWNAVVGAAEYVIENNTGVRIGNTTSTTYTISNLTPNTQYTYRVRGKYVNGEGDLSVPITKTTLKNYIYDSINRLTDIYLPNGMHIRFEYDNNGNLKTRELITH